MRARILIVDDHSMLRDGLCQLIESDPDLRVSGQAANGHDAIKILDVDPPDILLVDLCMEGLNGAMVIQAAKKMCPDVRVVVLTAYSSASYVFSALSCGAHGYVVKSEPGERVLQALHCVLKGLFYISPDITEEVVTGYIQGKQSATTELYAHLTEREIEIVDSIIMGNIRNKALAECLCLSERSVERHKTNIFRKLGVSNTQELLDKCAEVELLKR
ncbi:response regulator [Pseudodesulfovibrio sp. JC047]|uniref:response regulator n=1 Tax=Pseudodesulfovibrio sp. JC047 TaxID=2683199 RepID=UPI0013D76FB7|nr:response regulator transcription factor [Pseudodesulfovibrio sp. JC047]NDV20987.1 response regulator [Pseudodesulfovibrio sp. JC047]